MSGTILNDFIRNGVARFKDGLPAMSEAGGRTLPRAEMMRSLFDLALYTELPTVLRSALPVLLSYGEEAGQLSLLIKESLDALQELVGWLRSAQEKVRTADVTEEDRARARKLIETGLANCDSTARVLKALLVQLDANPAPRDVQAVLTAIKTDDGRYVAGDEFVARLRAGGEL